MKNVGRIVTALAVVVSVLAPGAQHTAFADNAVMRITGNGGSSPGLTTYPTNQTAVTFSATGTVDSGNHTSTYPFSFSGSGYNETVIVGNGFGTLSGAITGTVSYNRNVNLMTVTGNVTFGSTSGSIQSGICVLVPTNANPTTNYNIVCEWVLTH